jgi:TonB family protein
MKLLLALLAAGALSFSSFADVDAPQDEPVFEASQGVTLPKATKTVRAFYLPDAMSERVQGRVVLQSVVTTAGRPTRIEVVQALDQRLDAEAVKALGQWEFEPGTKDGKPVPVRISGEMTFTLK